MDCLVVVSDYSKKASRGMTPSAPEGEPYRYGRIPQNLMRMRKKK